MATKTLHTPRVVVALAAAITVLFAWLVAAPSAVAAPGNIDTTQKGTITVHKFENLDPAPTNPNNGTEQTITGAKPIAQVTFTYAKVGGIDLTTSEGWTAVQGLTINDQGQVVNGATTYTVGAATPMGPTDDTGTTSVGDLDLGVYLVTETDAPSNVVAKADPFLVTVPMPNADGFLYNVHVYPKNTVLQDDEKPVKKVDNPGSTHFPGDAISWTITQKIPTLKAGETLTSYKVTDQMPAGVDKVDGATGVTVSVDRAGAPVALDAGDYKVTVSDANLVTVEFTPAGLAKRQQGDVVSVKIATTVSTNVAGPLENQSTTTINGVDFASTPGDGTGETPTTTDFAPFTIAKVNEKNEALDNAEFQIFPLPAGADQCPAEVPADTKTVTVKTGFNQDATGNAPGAAGTAGQATQVLVAGDYCVKETVAPAGYTAEGSGYAEFTKVTVAADTDAAVVDLTVTNKLAGSGAGSLLPGLPLTGAQGTVLLIGTGAVIALAGFVLASVARRRREVDA
ncbi:SpaH/EbpB family LPXTG-anchored major pilin [Trueperella abortisuis]|uniref:Fimbrial isopeptide formation D2 family protein/LPXTG-motif cell wall-anchored protein n=1 Tax=Trueperella abortisuis TaxID=445930 RepID=A0ABT9PFG7_9ACTO|nr:SpaH/EbpB family LPXTG-anchored major pilin [Trueperella abortisuis]MDP9831453.1 fimbrial isopeptide formation D2 family protein/LPXTG-motif cell wall-anchored protein [Trueperella abortisuis]